MAFTTWATHDGPEPYIGPRVVRFLPAGDHPRYLGKPVVRNVGQNLNWFENDVFGPICAGADELAILCLRLTKVLNCVRTGPDGAGGGCVIVPRDFLRVEQVGQGGMFKARILRARFVREGIDHLNECARCSRAAGGGIFGREQIAGGRCCRCPRNDELMGGKAGSLVSLKHAVGEGVLLSQREVGLDLRWIHIHELWVRRRTVGSTLGAGDLDLIGTIHFATIIHRHKCGVGVAEIVVIAQVDGRQRNDLYRGINTAAGDVRTPRDQDWILKQIVGGAVLLENNDDVLDL